MVINKPTFLDSSSKFEPKQYEKINQMVNAQFKRFMSRAVQKQLEESKPEAILESYTGRCINVNSYFYNGQAVISFLLNTKELEEGTRNTIMHLKKEPTSSISALGSKNYDGTDSISNYGYFVVLNNDIQFIPYITFTESYYLYVTLRFKV